MPWYVGFTANYGPDIDYFTSIHPAGKAGPLAEVSAHARTIPANARHKKEAWKLISFLFREDIDFEWHKNLQFLPTRKSTAETPYFAEHKAWSSFVKQLANGKHLPTFPKYREAVNIIQPELEAAWLGVKTPKDALDTAAKKVQKLLEEE